MCASKENVRYQPAMPGLTSPLNTGVISSRKRDREAKLITPNHLTGKPGRRPNVEIYDVMGTDADWPI